MEPSRTASLSVPEGPGGVGQARRFAQAQVGAWGLAALAEVTVLLVSEAVTNALLHTGSSPVLWLGARGGLLRVEVRDASPVLPALRPRNELAATGRGLRLIDALAARWGSESAAGGKVVWFELEHHGGKGAAARGQGTAVGRSTGWRPREDHQADWDLASRRRPRRPGCATARAGSGPGG